MSEVSSFFNLLKACHDGLGFYPAGNPVVSQQCHHFIQTAHHLMVGNHLWFALESRGLLVNGALQESLHGNPVSTWFVGKMRDRLIQTIIFHRDFALRDVEALAHLLLSPPTQFTSPSIAMHYLNNKGVWRIQVNVAPPNQVDESEPFNVFGVDQTVTDLTLNDVTVQLPSMDQRLQVMPDADAFAPPENEREVLPQIQTKLLIPEAEQATLYGVIDSYLEEGNLKRVADTLKLIHQDFSSENREERELSYSSFHVVVCCMLQHHQDERLYLVLKSMNRDLMACQETDLYNIHLNSVCAIVRHYRDKGYRRGLLYGLNLLANQNLRQHLERRRLVDEQLRRILDPDLVEALLNETDPELLSACKVLFYRHGMGLIKPLLEALFVAEDRTVRKRLLEILSNTGTLSYPYLMEELRLAIEDNRPWYIKRNLLTLLSINPPLELASHLPTLYQTNQPKMRDLVVRCLFQIASPEVFGLGKKLLREADRSHAMKILRYLKVYRHRAYARDVMDVFRRFDDDQLRLEAIQVLGKIDSDEAISLLDEIVAGTRVDQGKVQDEHRLAAIRLLGKSKHERARVLLTHHHKDRNRYVREAARQILESH